MKKIIFSLLLSLTLFSCSNHSDIANQTDDRFLYDYNGIIIDKFVIGDHWAQPHYYFIIESIEDAQMFEWNTDMKNYENKEIGDTVHFDYIKKDRIITN